MKQFNINELLKKYKFVTRNGREITNVSVEADDLYPLRANIEGRGDISATEKGFRFRDQESPEDIFIDDDTNEFVFGEEVEITDSSSGSWSKRIFVGQTENRFFCVVDSDERAFHSEHAFSVVGWKYCRKLQTKTKITREEFKNRFNIDLDDFEITN